ncbi:MAG TPA: DUF1731 domain-containing protein [Opitutaceae bacterium]|nr:DUF1731 domain-containing protein [Opitutaceae bacterium]
MKVVIAGGTGQVGNILIRYLHAAGHDCVVLTRKGQVAPSVQAEGKGAVQFVLWDGASLGTWVNELEGAGAIINLAGRSVNCRYHQQNLQAMMESRIESTRVIGIALSQARLPPPVWLQASTATVYAHRYDAPNDEKSGVIGGTEIGVPALWKKSVEIALAWEETLFRASTPNVRRVALRSAMVMSPDRGGIFDVLCSLARRGLGGTQGSGDQFVSWIHETDFAHAVIFLLRRNDLHGAINLCSPAPLPNRDFLHALRTSLGVRFAPRNPAWLLEIGAFFMRTETELILKSRRVIPGRLRQEGYSFQFPTWAEAVADLVPRWKTEGLRFSTAQR